MYKQSMLRNLFLVFIGQAFTFQVANAQEVLSLDSADISRLGIVFETVKMTDQETGAKVPAMIINSPDSISSVTSLYSGILTQWLVKPSDEVSEGEILALIKSDSLLDLENQWSTTLRSKDRLSDDLIKDTSLFEQGIISQQRLLTTQRDFQAIEFTLAALQEKLAQAGISAGQIQNLRNGSVELGIQYLRAPQAGIISQRNAALGEFVQSNSIVASLQTNKRTWLEAEVPQRLAGSLKLGQSLSIDETGQALSLEVMDTSLDRATQTLGIQAEFVEATNLLPGQLVTVLIPPLEQGVLIPSNAVVHSGDDTSVFVKAQGGVVVRNLVLIPSGANYVAESGVRAGEELVVQGTAVLKGMLLGLGGE